MTKRRPGKGASPRRAVTSAPRGRRQDAPSSSPRDRDSLEHEIRLRAYYRYLEREGEAGDAVTDWLEAEADVLGRPASALNDREPDEEAGLD